MHAFFRVGAVDHEGVGSGSAAVDGLLAIIQIARYLGCANSRCVAVLAMRIRRYAGLQFQKVDVGSSVQWHRGDLSAIDEHPVLCALGLYLKRIAFHIDGIVDCSELHGDVNANRGIGIDLYSALQVIAKASLAGSDIVSVNAEGGKVIEAFGIGD